MKTRLEVILLVLLSLSLGCGETRRPTADGSMTDVMSDAPDASMDATPDGPARDAVIVPDDTVIYAHSGDTLYSFDADTNTVETIALFRAPDDDTGSVLDLAVNEQGDVFVATRTGLYKCNTTTAFLTRIATYEDGEGGFNAMTFVPAGVLDPNDEVLIGVGTTDIVRIDVNNGQTTPVAMYADDYVSSGDIVSVTNFGTYATIRDPDNEDGPDLLAELTPSTGQVRVVGSTGFSRIFGLGFWKGNLYGFTDAGELISIDPTNARATLVSDSTGAERFFGAGVTTVAPLI